MVARLELSGTDCPSGRLTSALQLASSLGSVRMVMVTGVAAAPLGEVTTKEYDTDWLVGARESEADRAAGERLAPGRSKKVKFAA